MEQNEWTRQDLEELASDFRQLLKMADTAHTKELEEFIFNLRDKWEIWED